MLTCKICLPTKFLNAVTLVEGAVKLFMSMPESLQVKVMSPGVPVESVSDLVIKEFISQRAAQIFQNVDFDIAKFEELVRGSQRLKQSKRQHRKK